MPPLLEVLTRTYRRPSLLAANQASLARQTSHDWTQTVIVDTEGLGVARANRNMAAQAHNLVGKYIWVLDDDDVCIRPTLTAELGQICGYNGPDVVLVRMDHGPRGILPDALNWGRRAVREGHIGCSAYIVRREIWQRHAQAWGERYAGDYDFIAAVMSDTSVRIYWHDCVASRVQMIGLGRPEGESMQVKANQTFNAQIAGQSWRLLQGKVYDIPPEAVHDLLRAGYVTPVAVSRETAAIEPGQTPEMGIPAAGRKKAGK